LLEGLAMRIQALVSILAIAAFAACKKPAPAEEQSAPAAASATPVASTSGGGGDGAAKAKEIFANRCTPCHGPEGRGDGVASQSLDPKPRNFHDPAWHASIDDAYIEKIIKFGGAAVGKSPAMPGNPDLNDPVVVAELRTLVRSFNN
jgi:mono/diheme cytochrome c family protein